MTAGAYLISIAEVANSVHQIGTGALLIINNCTLGLFLENDGKYQFENVKKNTWIIKKIKKGWEIPATSNKRTLLHLLNMPLKPASTQYLVILNDWVSVYELSGCGFESHYSHLGYSSLKNILSLQNCIIQWNHLKKNCKYLKYVTSIFLKMKFHVKQSPIKWQILDFTPKDFQKLQKLLVSKWIFLKKITIIYGKGKSSKIRKGISNVSLEAANIFDNLQMEAVSDGLIAVILKQNLKYRDQVYFDWVCRKTIY